jgi:hypothetical protein
MTVEAFQKALEARPNARFAIVSETLFFLLDNLGQIECRTIEKGLPDRPEQHGPIRALLRDHVHKTSSALKMSYFVLKSRPQIHIHCVMLHGFHVDDVGPNSFVICGDLTSLPREWGGAETHNEDPPPGGGQIGVGPLNAPWRG